MDVKIHMPTTSPLRKYHEGSWSTGVMIQYDAWVHKECIVWYYEAHPQLSEDVMFKDVQTNEDFLNYGPPEVYSNAFKPEIISEMERFIRSIYVMPFELNQYQKNILDLIRIKKKFTLEGNKEYFEIIEFQDDSIVICGGDTMSNHEEYRRTIDERWAFDKIKNYYLNKSKFYFSNNKKIIKTDNQLLDFIRNNPHI